MSTEMKPPVVRRYSILVVLGVACIVGYGVRQGWFGLGSREVESEGASADISQPHDQIDVPPLVTAQDATSKSQ